MISRGEVLAGVAGQRPAAKRENLGMEVSVERRPGVLGVCLVSTLSAGRTRSIGFLAYADKPCDFLIVEHPSACHTFGPPLTLQRGGVGGAWSGESGWPS